jgi:hypothetical protein
VKIVSKGKSGEDYYFELVGKMPVPLNLAKKRDKILRYNRS